jgi:hypothetical protein
MVKENIKIHIYIFFNFEKWFTTLSLDQDLNLRPLVVHTSTLTI